jgi:hypothetical protein
MTYGVYPCSKCGYNYNYPAEPPDDIHTILRVSSCPVGDSIKQEYECGNCHAINERYRDFVHFINIIDRRYNRKVENDVHISNSKSLGFNRHIVSHIMGIFENGFVHNKAYNRRDFYHRHCM